MGTGRMILGPPLALGLGLTSHGPLHLRRDLHVLDLHHRYLHPPGVGLLVDYGLQLLVYLLAVGEKLVEVLLPQHAPEGGLAYLAGGQHVVLDLDDAPVGVHHAEVDHGVDAGGDVVAGYDVLWGDVHGYGPQVYLDHPVHHGKEDEKSWSLGPPLYPTEAEDDAPLVLLDDLDGAEYDRNDEDREDHHHDGRESYPNRLQQA